MCEDNKYIWWRIVAFCGGTDEEIAEMRQALFSVCKQWRNEFKMHLWVHPMSAYRKALRGKNYHLANSIWDFSADCIDYNSENVVKAVVWYGQQLHEKKLIARDDFDPACYDNAAIRYASRNGHADVVQLLLQDDRVNPAAVDNAAILSASVNGHADVVQLLLQNDRVDPSVADNLPIRLASTDGYADVVRLLLQDRRVDPGAHDNYAIRHASRNGQTEVVALLLQDSRVDASAKYNYAIGWADENGHADVVALLIAKLMQ